MLASITGAILTGLAVQGLGRKSTMLWIALFMTLSITGLYLPTHGVDNMAAIYGSIVLVMLATGATGSIGATVMMDKSDPSSASTDYALQFSLNRGAGFVAGVGALTLAESIGYAGVLTTAVAVGMLSLLVVLFYNDFEPPIFAKPTVTQSAAVPEKD